MQFIGIDPGNVATKYAIFDNGIIKFGKIRNITGPAIRLDFPPTGRDEEIISVEVLSAEKEYRQPTFIGELAARQLEEYAGQDRSRNKVDSDGINLIVPTVLGLVDRGDQIVAAVGATLQDYAEQSPLIQQKLTRKHEVKFHYGTRAGQIKCPEVIRTYTYAQAAAGLVGMLKDDSGKARRADWNDATVLGLDFGHGQINVAIMDRLQFIKQSCFSVDYGFYRIHNAVADFLNTKYKVSLTIPQVQEATEKGFYRRREEVIKLDLEIGEACGKIMDLLYREITGKVSPAILDRISKVVILGGGSNYMTPYVRSHFNLEPEIADNYAFANARALLLIAKEKWEKENGCKTA